MIRTKHIYRFRQFLRRPEKSWGMILFLLLIFLVVVPVVYILINSFVFDAAGIRLVRGSKLGQATIFYWKRVLSSRISRAILYEPALHSLSIAIGMTAISITLGAFLAWLVVRTNLPWKRFFSMTLIIPYIVPSWTVALAWIMVFKSQRFGGNPGLLNALFGVNAPEWISFGYFPIIIALGVHYIPYSFILMRGALANIDSRLE